MKAESLGLQEVSRGVILYIVTYPKYFRIFVILSPHLVGKEIIPSLEYVLEKSVATRDFYSFDSILQTTKDFIPLHLVMEHKAVEEIWKDIIFKAHLDEFRNHLTNLIHYDNKDFTKTQFQHMKSYLHNKDPESPKLVYIRFITEAGVAWEKEIQDLASNSRTDFLRDLKLLISDSKERDALRLINTLKIQSSVPTNQ